MAEQGFGKTTNGKVALILEGGSFRCQFTAGVLDVLMENGVTFGACYGVSAGTLCGLSFKSHQIGRPNRVNLAFCNDSRYMGSRAVATSGSLVGYDFILYDVQDRIDPFDTSTYLANPMPLFATVSDIVFGTADYLEVKDPILDIDAVRASTSMPLVTPPVEIDGHLYLDGGPTQGHVSSTVVAADPLARDGIAILREGVIREPVIRKALVELDGKPFRYFASKRGEWAKETAYVYPDLAVDALASATPLSSSVDQSTVSLLDLLLGLHGGMLGETCILTILVGLAFLLFTRTISFAIPGSIVGTVFVLTLIASGDLHTAVAEILSGGLMFGAVFMATDYVTSPFTTRGKLIYGIVIGLLTFLIRNFGSMNEGMSYAILMGNLLTPWFNEWGHQIPLGRVKPKKKAENKAAAASAGKGGAA